MYVPKGYGTVFPYLIVKGANDFVSFLSNAFDAKELGRTELPDGRVANVRVGIGTSKFMVSEADGEKMPPMPAAHYVFVDDVDRTLEKAIACGSTKLFDAMDMDYQDRQAGISDPFGNIWWISKRLVEEPYDPD